MHDFEYTFAKFSRSILLHYCYRMGSPSCFCISQEVREKKPNLFFTKELYPLLSPRAGKVCSISLTEKQPQFQNIFLIFEVTRSVLLHVL